MTSSSRAYVAAFLGLLSLAAIPCGVLAAQLLASVGLLQALYVAVPTAIVLGADRRARWRGGPARQVDAQRVRRARGAGAVRARSSPGPGCGSGSRAASRSAVYGAAALGFVAHAHATDYPVRGRVRDREQPPRGASAPWRRLRPGGAGDEDPRQVPARARGRAVRAAARRRRTSRASCAPTPTTSASTASCTSTSSTPASSPVTSTIRGRGDRTRGRSAGTAGSETNVVLVALAAIVVLTVIVFSAWKWSGGDKRRRDAAAGRRRARPTLPRSAPRDHGRCSGSS